ncbi:hypothetical protein ACFWH4_01045 [Streptomyces sp. NPDC127091]|uniref:hypothetical protein n=1 Tax=Streptomyces sp. NPDC127091 TaxID=3347134 RepID=UPI003648CC93
MSHVQPVFDGMHLEAPAPAVSRRIVDDYEAWVDEVTPYYVAAADTGLPFTIDEVSRKHQLPDPPLPKTQWGSLPGRLLNDGIIRHHGYGGSARAKQSLVHVWIGVPAAHREAVARRRREDRKAKAAARAAERRAA